MSTLLATVLGAGQVLAAGLLFGVALPAVFAIGVWAHSWGNGELRTDDEDPVSDLRRATGRILLIVCFTIVGLGLFYGLGVILSSGLGMELTFNGLIPQFTGG